MAKGLWWEDTDVLPDHGWTDFSFWNEPPFSSLLSLCTCGPYARSPLSVPPVTPNWLILPISIVLTVQIFAATSPPPGSLPACPQAGSGASSELLHCPVPSLQPTHTKSPLPGHRVLPVFSSVSPVNSRCSIRFLNESSRPPAPVIVSSFSSLLVKSGPVLLSDNHPPG